MAGRKWNRKGFTLMEVMVSIALIGMLFTPILAFFSNSTQTNIRIKNIQRANTAAQAVMEEFRSYATIQDIANTYWSDNSTMFMTDENYIKSNRPAAILDSNGDFIKSSSGKYYFLKEEIESDGKKYIAKVEVDTSKYSNLNSIEMPVISSLGSETTVVAMEENETMNMIYEYQRLHFNQEGVNLDESYFANLLLKTMKVEITDTVTTTDEHGNTTSEAVADGMVHVRVYSEYSLTSPVSGCNNAQVGADIYNGLMEESRLQGIYVFFNFDVTNGTQNIMQGIDVSIDYQQEHDNWNCGYTVYAVCQGIHKVDEDVMLKDADMANYISTSPQTPSVKFTSNSNIRGVLYNKDSNPDKVAKIWTNFPSTNGDYPQSDINTIVGTEQIDRLSDLTVQICNADEPDKVVATMTSTRGE